MLMIEQKDAFAGLGVAKRYAAGKARLRIRRHDGHADRGEFIVGFAEQVRELAGGQGRYLEHGMSPVPLDLGVRLTRFRRVSDIAVPASPERKQAGDALRPRPVETLEICRLDDP
jgi:hypothetical protein